MSAKKKKKGGGIWRVFLLTQFKYATYAEAKNQSHLTN